MELKNPPPLPLRAGRICSGPRAPRIAIAWRHHFDSDGDGELDFKDPDTSGGSPVFAVPSLFAWILGGSWDFNFLGNTSRPIRSRVFGNSRFGPLLTKVLQKVRIYILFRPIRAKPYAVFPDR